MEGKVFALAVVVLPILPTVFFAGGATMSGLSAPGLALLKLFGRYLTILALAAD
jgi:hypothetical protein